MSPLQRVSGFSELASLTPFKILGGLDLSPHVLFLLPLNTVKIRLLIPEMKLYASVKNLSKNYVAVLTSRSALLVSEKRDRSGRFWRT
jgi:hypothetical protein